MNWCAFCIGRFGRFYVPVASTWLWFCWHFARTSLTSLRPTRKLFPTRRSRSPVRHYCQTSWPYIVRHLLFIDEEEQQRKTPQPWRRPHRNTQVPRLFPPTANSNCGKYVSENYVLHKVLGDCSLSRKKPTVAPKECLYIEEYFLNRWTPIDLLIDDS